MVVEQVQDLLSCLDGTTAVRKPLCVRAGELKVRKCLDRDRSSSIFSWGDVVHSLEERRHVDR